MIQQCFFYLFIWIEKSRSGSQNDFNWFSSKNLIYINKYISTTAKVLFALNICALGKIDYPTRVEPGYLIVYDLHPKHQLVLLFTVLVLGFISLAQFKSWIKMLIFGTMLEIWGSVCATWVSCRSLIITQWTDLVIVNEHLCDCGWLSCFYNAFTFLHYVHVIMFFFSWFMWSSCLHTHIYSITLNFLM